MGWLFLGNFSQALYIAEQHVNIIILMNVLFLLFSREKWSELLMLVNCTIISEKRNEDMIAYLLR